MDPFAKLPHRVIRQDQISSSACRLYAAIQGELSLEERRRGKHPDIGRLAAILSFSRQYIMTLIRELEDADLLIVQRRTGRPSRYILTEETRQQLLTGPDPDSDELTGQQLITGQLELTGQQLLTGTRQQLLTGSENSPYKGFKKEEKEESESPPPDDQQSQIQNANPGAARPAPNLFADQARHWFPKAVDYFLGEVPELAHYRPWYPEAIFELFQICGFMGDGQPRLDGTKTHDDPSNAVMWARQFHRQLAATESETREAINWDLATPMPKGQFSRTDHFRRIIDRIKDQRRVAKMRREEEANRAAFQHRAPGASLAEARKRLDDARRAEAARQGESADQGESHEERS